MKKLILLSLTLLLLGCLNQNIKNDGGVYRTCLNGSIVQISLDENNTYNANGVCLEDNCTESVRVSILQLNVSDVYETYNCYEDTSPGQFLYNKSVFFITCSTDGEYLYSNPACQRMDMWNGDSRFAIAFGIYSYYDVNKGWLDAPNKFLEPETHTSEVVNNTYYKVVCFYNETLYENTRIENHTITETVCE